MKASDRRDDDVRWKLQASKNQRFEQHIKDCDTRDDEQDIAISDHYREIRELKARKCPRLTEEPKKPGKALGPFSILIVFVLLVSVVGAEQATDIIKAFLS